MVRERGGEGRRGDWGLRASNGVLVEVVNMILILVCSF